MPGQDRPKQVKITPKMIAKAVAGPRTKQLRASSGPTGTIDHELLSHMPPSVPYDLGLLPAIAKARQAAANRGLIVMESTNGVVRLLKLPIPKELPQGNISLHRVRTGSSKARKARYAGSGAQN